MASGCVTVPAGSVMVCATGKLSLQVATAMPAEGCWPGMPICASYVVPGSSSTRLPRHSLFDGSYHMLRPERNDASPCLRKITAQPSAPGFDGGVQYRPIDSKVGTPRAPLIGRPETPVTVGVGVGVGVTVGVGVGDGVAVGVTVGVGVGDGVAVGVTVGVGVAAEAFWIFTL